MPPRTTRLRYWLLVPLAWLLFQGYVFLRAPTAPPHTAPPVKSDAAKTELLSRTFSPWMQPLRVVFDEHPPPGTDTRRFNPTVLPLPPGHGYRYPYLLAGRLPHEYKYDEEGVYYQSYIILCFADTDARMLDKLVCKTTPQRFHTDPQVTRTLVKRNATKWGNYHRFLGGEDPRLFWGPDGAPMMVYSLNAQHPERLRSIWVTDLRLVLPELDPAKVESAKGQRWNQLELGAQLPLLQQHSVEGTSTNNQHPLQSGLENELALVEKNWAPFLHENRLYMHSHIMNPRVVFQTDPPGPNHGAPAFQLPIRAYKTAHAHTTRSFEQCFRKHYPGAYQEVQIGRRAFHHASNFLRLTLCTREETLRKTSSAHCQDPSRQVHIGIVHFKDKPANRYTQFVVTWHAMQGFPIRSVVGPLLLPGHSLNTVNFVTSMNYWWPKKGTPQPAASMEHGGWDHGYLDSQVMVSFGVADVDGKVTFVQMDDLIRGEHLC